MRRGVGIGCACIIAMLSGCSVPTRQEAFDSVAQQTRTHLVWIKTDQDAREVDRRVRGLLSEPLSEENAIRIALINNRTLQQAYEEIGIAHAQLVQAGLWNNPVLGYSIGQGGGITTKTFGIEFAFLDLLWIPLKRELSGIALEETKHRVGDRILQTVRETRLAYAKARAAAEIVRLHDQLVRSYETSAQLAIRQYAAGNLSKRDSLKIQDAYAKARVEAIESRERSAELKEDLNTLMGLYAETTDYRFAAAEKGLKAPLPVSRNFERLAIENRLDIAAAKERFLYAAREAEMVDATRFAADGVIGLEREITTGEPSVDTLGVKIALPLFDRGQGRVAEAQARYNQAHHELYAVAVEARSEVRRSYAALRYAYDVLAEYRDVIVPGTREILDQSGLYYNGMLDGIYELLEDQRRLSEAKIGEIEAYGRYEEAVAQLEYAIGARMQDKGE